MMPANYLLLNLSIVLLADVDPCSINPCFNGGSCVNHPSGNYTCICKSGWAGKQCEVGKWQVLTLTKQRCAMKNSWRAVVVVFFFGFVLYVVVVVVFFLKFQLIDFLADSKKNSLLRINVVYL